MSEMPRIEKRRARVEQQRPDQLGCPDLGDAIRIAADGVNVVVWDIVSEGSSRAHRRRDDNGWIKLLQPKKSVAIVLRQRSTFRSARNERLE
jgi:hypothetical protein